MRLSPTQIAMIEKLLTAREMGMSYADIGERFQIGKHCEQKISYTLQTLGAIGLPVPPRMWAPRKPKAKKPLVSVSKPSRRVILTAEQWQERLAQHGAA